MSSETPPMTHVTTRYEDIPPRYRKLWIKGNEERVQKKLNAPIQDFLFSLPLQQSNSESSLPQSLEYRSSRSHFLGGSDRAASDSSISPYPLQKRPRIDDAALEPLDNRGGDGAATWSRPGKEKEKDLQSSLPIAYSGPPAMQRIIDSVVEENVARTTPPPSRSNSPAGTLSLYSKYRAPSRSRPATRPTSPNMGTLAATPTGWTALTSRHSLRRFDIRPWGPRHLEYDYNEARKEFQSAAYYALGQYGYIPPRGIVKFKAPPPDALPSMSDLRKVPVFSKACRRLDAADRALEEALARGQTWDNTPVPKEYLQFSLENVSPEDIRTGRPDNTAGQDRSRSSVTLEEEANRIDTSRPVESSSLSRSSTLSTDVGQTLTSTSASTSTSFSEQSQEAMAVDETKSSDTISSFAQLNISDDQSPPTESVPPSTSPTPASEPSSSTTPTSTPTPTQAQNTPAPTPIMSPGPALIADTNMPPAQLVRKRLLEEVDNDNDSDRDKGMGKGEGEDKGNDSRSGKRKAKGDGLWLDISSLSPAPTRVCSPVPPASRSPTRTARSSTSVSPSASAALDVSASRESLMSTPVSRTPSARARRRGSGRR